MLTETIPMRPLLRGRLHQVAFVASLFGLVSLVDAAATPRARAVAWVYGLASALLYLTSSTYHVFARSPRARRIMQRADHSMIFVLIAGTFTPLAVLGVAGPWKWAALVAVWLAALAGVVLKVVAIDRYPRLGGALYIVIGWAGVVVFPALSDRPGTLALVVVGGLLAGDAGDDALSVGGRPAARALPAGIEGQGSQDRYCL